MDTTEERFKRWVEVPLELLRNIGNGDGAFATLSICFGLYERFVHSSIQSSNTQTNPEFFGFAGKDLDCEPETFKRFWECYRVGMQHAFQPKNYHEKKGTGDRWGWEMAAESGFHAFPVITNPDPNLYIIRIDPWKFADHVLARWKANLQLLDEISVFTFGKVVPTEAPLPRESDPVNLTGCKTVYEGHPGIPWKAGEGSSSHPAP
jgi:hypothetical protein